MKPDQKTLLAVLLLSGSLAHAYQPNKTYRFTVLHTNDLHGRFWANEQGEYGLAAQKTLVDQIRREVKAQGGSVLVLNAGDINTGVPESDLQNARPDIEGMNAVGYDAMTLGNHEFDNPLQLLAMQQKWAKFPFLSANTVYKSSGKPLVKPYTVIERGGLKFAVIGLTTEDTAFLSAPDYTAKVQFLDAQQSARKALAAAQRAKPDVRIALSHLGYYHNGGHGKSAPGDVSLARSLPENAFDLIIGGHTHTAVCLNGDGSLNTRYQPAQPCRPDFQNGTWIVQAGEWGKYLGRADFEFRNGKTKLVGYQLIPINLKAKSKDADGNTRYTPYQPEIASHAATLAKLKTYQDKGGALLGVKAGSINGTFESDRAVFRHRQTDLGQLITRAMMERTQADFAVLNSGGIRDTLPEGEITYKHLLKVQPFGNTLSLVTLSGKEVQDFVQTVAFKDKGSGGYPQWAGISMSVCPADKSVRNIRIGGQPLDNGKNYRMVLPSYLAGGGDSYPLLRNHASYADTGFVDAEALKEYFGNHSPIHAADYAPDTVSETQGCPAP